MIIIHYGNTRGRHGAGRWHRAPWRIKSAAATLVLAVASSGLTVEGTVATAPRAEAMGLAVAATGGYHTCALMPDQSVWCWGQNTVGQLGNGATADSLVPVRVTGLPAATDVAAGEYHTCAVDTAHRVWCWGSNAYGELGNGTTSQDSPVPGQVTGGLLAAQVSAGHEFSCAVTLAQTVDCWGDNNYGELGNGTTTDSSTPVAVKGLTNVLQVAAGYYHACARESNGTLWCWGDNGNGELGNNSTKKKSSVPVIVGMQNVADVAAGNSDTCAIGNAPGDLWCWGWNDIGQVGDGTTTDRHLPTQVAGLASGVQQVSAGLDSTCAIADIPGPAALCWGDNYHGKIGDGTGRTSTAFPSQVFGLQTPASGGPAGEPYQVAAGGQHACAVLTSSVLRCWGYGYYGQLGNGSSLDKFIPTTVIGLPGLSAQSVSAVSAGNTTGCAVTATLNAACWGEAAGDGSPLTAVHTSAVAVQSLPAGGVSEVIAGLGGCALVRTGALATAVKCWGQNTYGQLGDGKTTDQTKPVKVQGLASRPESLSSSGVDACAVVHDGGADCWGLNDHGQLGSNGTANSATAVAVQGLPPGATVAQIAAADDHTCALLTDETVWCWGSNNHGQLGDGSTSDSDTPVAVTGLPAVVAISAGHQFTCAVDNAGNVECWGYNQYGQLGNGSTSDSSTPVLAGGVGLGAVAIASGDESSCAALFSGTVDCWGNNAAGQLGNGSVGGTGTSPAAVSGFNSNGGIGSGQGMSMCALDLGGQANCWGDNTFGELGDGTSGAATDSGTPLAVQGL
jgi:alpha-tubulin suppressor-like RCC1 family protein